MPTPVVPPLLPPSRTRRRALRSRLAGARRRAAVVTSALLLSACAAPNPATDAPDTPRSAPTWTASVPVSPAEAPRPEPVPITSVSDTEAAVEGVLLGEGEASYYGADFAGRPTASGERFDPSDLTAAHRTLPFGTRLRVTNVRTGESVIVRVNDRGPFHGDRVIDLSRAAADAIGLTQQGTGAVRIERLPTELRGVRG